MPAPCQFGDASTASSGSAHPAINDHGEEGYILVAVLFLVALVLIGLAVAAPRMAQSIQRDKEIELVHRGEQYKRAIKLYYRKFGAYPTSIDQLLNTNNIRFLRKRYPDPITGKNDWRLIHLGQAKVPPLGFFGQPLTGVPGAANIGAPVSAATGPAPSPFGAPAAPSTFGAAGANAPGPTSSFGAPDSGIAGSESSPAGPTTTSPTTAGSASTSPGGSSGATSGLGGVGAIVGVGIPSTKASLLDYKKQTHYNQWEFVYNPIEDQMRQAAGMLGAGTGNVNGTSSAPNNSPFGSSTTNTSPFSSSPSPFGSSTNNSPGGTSSTMGSGPR